MCVVAITRWGGEPGAKANESQLGLLAELAGVGAYDARQLAARDIPVIAVRTLDSAEASAALGRIIREGMGAVACDVGVVNPLRVRAFRLEETSLHITSGNGEPRIGDPDKWETLGFSDVVSIILTLCKTDDRSVETVMVMETDASGDRHEQRYEQHSSKQSAERVLYVYNSSGTVVASMGQESVRFGGMGQPLERTTLGNFNKLLGLLRARCAGAYFDDRMLHRARVAGTVSIRGASNDQTVSTTNRGETDLAAHLLTVAQLQKQL